MTILKDIQPGRDEQYKFIWTGCPLKNVYVHSCYINFMQKHQNPTLETKLKEALEVM